MQNAGDMMDRLNHSGRRLSKSHRLIAEYITSHYDKAVFMTAASLGECVGVSESTVVRFASALGYDGYPQLQRSLQELVSHRLTASERFERVTETDPRDVPSAVLKSDIQNLHSTLEELDPAVFEQVVSRILSARSVYVIGLRSAAPLAQFLVNYLRYMFDHVRLVSGGAADGPEDMLEIGASDVLIGISFPRYSARTVEVMRFARHCGAQVIAVTDGPMSPLCEVSDACLTARTDIASFVDSLAAPLSVINALLVSLSLHRKDALSGHFRRLEDIWKSYRVYLEEDRHA